MSEPEITTEKNKLSILLIEDNLEDQFLVRRMLSQAPATDYTVRAVHKRTEAMDALTHSFDACLLDYELGAFTALDLLAKVDTVELPGPVILLTGHEDFNIDQSALDLGVADFVAKSELRTGLLDRTIRYACRRFIDKRQLSHLAHHDALTGLLNRHAFLAQLKTWLRTDVYKSSDLYVLYIDLDGFKAVNDTWGHDLGDRVLCHAAECIRSTLRSTDLVARYGGDELVAAVPQIDEESLNHITEKILTRLRSPIRIGGRDVVVTASIGVARAHHAPNDADELIRLADHAMFAAKHGGRDTTRTFSDDIPIAQRNRAELESDLRAAISHSELNLVYQPHIDMCSGSILGAEALARWTHPEKGNISPVEFIPLAEECGLIRQFTTWTLNVALATLAQWQKSELLPETFRLGVNVSPQQLLDPEFAPQLFALIEKHGIEQQFLRLEITENFFVHEKASTYLHTLTANGISLALDDFGTGYSSLSMLSQLPVDTLKIDRSFVVRMGHDPRTITLIKSLITLGQAMDMEVIAEGVETISQRDQLISYGCKIAQGFLFSKPVSSETISKHLEAGVIRL